MIHNSGIIKKNRETVPDQFEMSQHKHIRFFLLLNFQKEKQLHL